MSSSSSSTTDSSSWLDAPADCTLACDKGHITAHKQILCHHSKYLNDILSKHPNADHPIIILTELNIIDIKILVNYMYTGELVITNDSSPTSLLRAAQILKIDSLTDDVDSPDDLDASEDSDAQDLHTSYADPTSSLITSTSPGPNQQRGSTSSAASSLDQLNNQQQQQQSQPHHLQQDLKTNSNSSVAAQAMSLFAGHLDLQDLRSLSNHFQDHAQELQDLRILQSLQDSRDLQDAADLQEANDLHDFQDSKDHLDSKNNKIRCHLCNIGLSDVKCLYRHVLTRHLPEKWGYKCEFCDREFSRDDHLMRHYTTKHKNMEFNREKIRETRRLNREMAKNFHDQISTA